MSKRVKTSFPFSGYLILKNCNNVLQGLFRFSSHLSRFSLAWKHQTRENYSPCGFGLLDTSTGFGFGCCAVFVDSSPIGRIRTILETETIPGCWPKWKGDSSDDAVLPGKGGRIDPVSETFPN